MVGRDGYALRREATSIVGQGTRPQIEEDGAGYEITTSCSKYRTEQQKNTRKECFMWWEGMDSNHRRLSRRIYSPLHLAALQPSQKNGAGDRNRTYNLLITSQLLYR